jgi:quinol-cytochrome oxidoreductase complex cytochrome b subunit
VSSRSGFGIWGFWDLDKVSGGRWILANFFSLHSWMGLICVSLFGAQIFFFHHSRGGDNEREEKKLIKKKKTKKIKNNILML